jgi:hypothetical protein
MIQDDDAIVSLEAWRHLKRPGGTAVCQHAKTVIDEQAGTITCRDCEATLSAFWVLGRIAREENRVFERIRSLRAEAETLKAWVPFLRAQRTLERRWRGRATLPVCPFCTHGLWPEDLQSGLSLELEIARRRKDGLPIPSGAKERAP